MAREVVVGVVHGAPQYRLKSSSLETPVVEAIRFVLADDTTHWHVNLGHPVIEAVQDKYWVMTSKGAQVINDGDWVAECAGVRSIIPNDQFSSSYVPVEPE